MHSLAAVLGMGRATFLRLPDEHGLRVIGVGHDDLRAAELRDQGFDVVCAGATDGEIVDGR